MRKLLVLALVAMIGSLLWIGCGNEADSQEEMEVKDVTIRVMSPESDFTDEWITMWNDANPNITVVREDHDPVKWIADYMSGTSADLMNQGLGAENPYFVKRGMFLNLTDYFENSELFSVDDIDKGGCAAYFVDGNWYGLPKDYNNVTAITYNKDIFDANGLPYPSATEPMTYDEFYTLAADLADLGADPQIFGTEVHTTWIFFVANDKIKMLGKTMHSADGKTMNEDPAVRGVWKEYLMLRGDGISANLENTLSGWAGAAFQADTLAMVQLGYWYGASCAGVEGYQDKYAWAPAPIMEEGGKRVTNSLGATGFVISSKTENPDEAFAVFEWYMAGEPGVERAETGWGIPPLKSLQPLLPEGNEFDKSRKEIALEEVKYMQAPEITPYVRAATYNTSWIEAEQAYMRGEVDMDGAVDMFYGAMNEALELGREELGE